ncbi:MAG: hypothetical protein CME71_01320 [Halobacteriovorax sp.]|nr:hypothetical protein [Halobacteriovorax sp.]
MKDLNQWLEEYSVSHRHPTNKLIHNICVPLIMFSVLGLFWAIPRPDFLVDSIYFNWATIFSALCMIFYISLGLKTALLMLFVLIPMLILLAMLETIGVPILVTSIVIFVVSWIGQFVGHKIEGKKPSFFQDLQFLLIGPLWVFNKFAS